MSELATYIYDGQKRLEKKIDLIRLDIGTLRDDRFACRLDCDKQINTLKVNFLKIIIIALFSGAAGGFVSNVAKAMLKVF